MRFHSITRTAALALLVLASLKACAQDLPPDHTGHDHDHADPRPFPALTISVKIDEEKDAASGDMVRTIRGSGTSGYPEGSSLVMEARMKGAAGFLDKRHQTFVDANGGWEAAIDDLGRNVYKGVYEIRITWDPTFQAAGLMNLMDKKNLNDKIQSKSVEVRFGTPEEEAREKADVDQLYARAFATAKSACEDTFREYEKQKKTPDRLSWGDFLTDVNDKLVRGDREMGEFRRSRDNLRDYPIYEKIASLYAVTTTMLYPALTSALGVEGGRASDTEKQSAESLLTNIRNTIADLDQTIGKVAIDPNWKPADAKPVKIDRPKPPVRPIHDDAFKPPQNSGPPPIGTGKVPKSRFGVAELGIGLAVMCGLAMLVLLLKRK